MAKHLIPSWVHATSQVTLPENPHRLAELTEHTKDGSITSTRISISTGSYSLTN